ncbi:MAG: sugar nucleotide-binding protein, partial [Hyphomicrobiales bacterium]
MKILVLGKNGQVASSLAELSDGLIFHDRHSADFTNPQSCVELVEAFEGDVIVNAAAYTNVEKAESEEELASLINGTTPGAIAKCAAGKNIPIIHISTDYVFDGKSEAPWQPDDNVNPINAYGRSKLAGERLIQESGCQ